SSAAGEGVLVAHPSIGKEARLPDACPGFEELSAYAGGSAEGAPEAVDLGRARIEGHAAGCGRCREELAVLALLSAPESPEEAAAIEAVALRRGDEEELLDAAAARAREPAVPPPAVPRTGALRASTATSSATPTSRPNRSPVARRLRRPIWRAV